MAGLLCLPSVALLPALLLAGGGGGRSREPSAQKPATSNLAGNWNSTREGVADDEEDDSSEDADTEANWAGTKRSATAASMADGAKENEGEEEEGEASPSASSSSSFSSTRTGATCSAGCLFRFFFSFSGDGGCGAASGAALLFVSFVALSLLLLLLLLVVERRGCFVGLLRASLLPPLNAATASEPVGFGDSGWFSTTFSSCDDIHSNREGQEK